MKKLKTTLLAALLIAIIMPACKKGENDPAISLRSRKARVAGEWKVTSGSGTNVYTSSWGNSSSSWTYDGTTYSETFGSVTTSRPRTMEYTFEKDGMFTHKDVDDGETMTGEGEWNFSGGVGEVERKSEMVLFFTKATSPSGTYSYSGYYPFFTYEIDELRNDKMVLKTHYKSISSSGDVSENTEEWVLEAK